MLFNLLMLSEGTVDLCIPGCSSVHCSVCYKAGIYLLLWIFKCSYVDYYNTFWDLSGKVLRVPLKTGGVGEALSTRQDWTLCFSGILCETHHLQVHSERDLFSLHHVSLSYQTSDRSFINAIKCICKLVAFGEHTVKYVFMLFTMICKALFPSYK